MAIAVHFLPDEVTILAEPGESLLTVAERAGVFIPTGCLLGSCHACEVELEDGTAICACLSCVPGDRPSLRIHLY
ncbi:MAG: 2Fe-2S iron-sulfur cluster-binding protein, partial [Microcystaceae cyanobacterium]